MDGIIDTDQLYEYLESHQPQAPSELDIQTVKYALYARKSTTNEDRQERSIDDQIKDCMERVVLIDKIKLVQAPIEESCSAKEPDIRPKFRKLIEDIKSGRITGLVAWHPDRLARNMKEAGEIIDLLDKGTLKDLRFATSTFENNPTGKMLLGISFVLSKQYSEHLSESIHRGNKRITEEAKYIGKMKHGYYVDEDGRLYPDGDNFIIVKRIFEMRTEGKSQPEIAKWLNTTPYRLRKRGKEPIAYKWDKDSVSKLLSDPVYAGVLKYGRQLVNLPKVYDFTPAIGVKEFLKLNKVSKFDSSKLVSSMSVKGGNIQANLLRGMIICGYCEKPFSSGLTSKQLKDERVYYYNYKCETDSCGFRNKSVRAKVVLEFATDFFRKYWFVTEENYEQYVKDAKKYISSKTKDVDSYIASLSKLSGEKNKEYEETKTLIKDNPFLHSHYDLDGIKKEFQDLAEKLESVKQERLAVKDSIMTYKEYLELFKSIPVILTEMRDMEAMDKILRKFFSNLTIKDLGRGQEQRYEIDYKLNEPWDGFVKNNNFDHGRGERTRTFDLTVPNRAR